MNPSELRIGNLIIQGNTPTIVEHIKTSIDDYDRINHKRAIDCSPIPLTEEWLLEFGFKDINNKSFKLFKHTHHDIILRIFDGGAISYCEKNEYVLVKSVHHLQNLYYALTQKEL